MTQTTTQLSDAQLVNRLKQRDRSALDDLVRIHGAKLYGVALQFMRNDPDAEDVMQDALVAIWSKIGTFEGRSAFTSWLYRVTANAALMALRKRRRHDNDVSLDDTSSDAPGSVRELSAPTELPNHTVLHEELGQRVRALIDRLPDAYRSIVLLRDVEEMSLEEIAEATGLSQSAIKSRLHRGRLILREALLPYLSGEGTGRKP